MFPQRALHRRPRRGAGRRHRRRRRAGHASADPRRAGASGCWRPASTASSRSRWPSRSADAEAVVAAARAAGSRADGRPPARVPPGRRQAQGADRRRRARPRALHLRQPAEPRQAARGRERAVVARRPRRLGAAAARRRGALRGRGARRELHARGGRGRRLLLPALPVRARRPPAPVVAGPAQGAPLHRRRRAADGDVRRHGARGQDHGLRQGLRRAARSSYGEYITRSGDIWSPRLSNVEPLRTECGHFVDVDPQRHDADRPTARPACASCACSRRSSGRWTRRAARASRARWR